RDCFQSLYSLVWPDEGRLENVIHRFSNNKIHSLFHIFWEVIQILLVPFGQNNFSDAILLAASVFSLSPPMGRTLPLNVTSPFMAISFLTALPVSADAMAVAIVIPADGPSFGIAPAGTWICRSTFEKISSLMPSSFDLDRT